MRIKRLSLLVSAVFSCSVLTGCVSPNSGLPITPLEPVSTLPPAEVSYVAPIGDAALEYTEKATLYLPSHDGISLAAVESEVAYSPVRPQAESLVRALLVHPSGKEAAALGGDVRLSLYGTSPVEVSRDTVTINLSASALQLSRQALYIACQAIANTLTQLPEISHVNFLVVDKPVGIDIAGTLPMGALKANTAPDLGAVYEQLLSRRVLSAENASDKPFSANVTLYFPLNAAEGMVSEVRTMSFENQVFPDMVTAILRALAAGPENEGILSPALPLLADLLTSAPVLQPSEDTGSNVIHLDFAHNLEDMLEAYGISQQQSIASLCCTLATFFPNVSGVQITINGASPQMAENVAEDEEAAETEETKDNAENEAEEKTVPPVYKRSDFSSLLYDYCTLYFAKDGHNAPVATLRPVHYYQAHHPRKLLSELSRGPQSCDSQPDLLPVMDPSVSVTDTMLLGFSLSDNTLLVNLAPGFNDAAQRLTAEEERLLAYSMVNTLCLNERIKSVCFFRSGSQFDGFGGEIYWGGLFYPLPY